MILDLLGRPFPLGRVSHSILLSLAVILAATFAPAPGLAQAGATSRQPKAQRIARPKRSSLEYRLSWGLTSIKADRAYTRGIDGRGVTVAMIDAGMTLDAMRLFTHVSPAGVDLVEKRVIRADGSHARQTATVLAAPLDEKGTLGVAYGANLLSIRIDADGSCARECYAHGRDLARGIDYALAAGARVIAVPLVGSRPLESVEPALERAAAAGALIVAAAGNEGAQEASWPARYAADPRFRDTILVVGASTITGEAAKWTNRAGSAAARYLMAPGENLLVDCDAHYCRLVSGTSYAVPYVAGAVSLVMAARPDLSAQDAAEVLLTAASDRTMAGVDDHTGRGLLNVQRAFKELARHG
jgi:subtilisin family serine protease